jgi:ABC-type uncharacterized transport system substrate-binding protein
MHRICSAALAAFAMLAASIGAASAHPHVWVTAKSNLEVTPDGKVLAIRHSWTFDEPFSAYATMGMDTNKDGKLSREELTPLAKVNVESLNEYGFFTFLRKGKTQAQFREPENFFLEHDGKALTLHFTLPLADTSLALTDLRLEVSDPSFFVAFEFAKDNPVLVSGHRGQCKAELKRPAPAVFNRLSQLDESFFDSGQGAGLGLEFATTVQFSCR